MSIYDHIGVVYSDVYNAMDGTVGSKCYFEIGIPKSGIKIGKYDTCLGVISGDSCGW
jgi:hypothetical protein